MPAYLSKQSVNMPVAHLSTTHPASPGSMPSPITPADGASFYPTATDIDGKLTKLSPRYKDVKPSVVLTTGPDQHVSSAPVVVSFNELSLVAPPTATTSLLSDLDDIDALQCHWDMKHFEPGKLTESDLTCLDTPTASVTATPITPSVFVNPSAPLVTPDRPPPFSILSQPSLYHPYYPQPQQQTFSSEYNLDYSTPEVKELLCTGWLESDLLNVN